MSARAGGALGGLLAGLWRGIAGAAGLVLATRARIAPEHPEDSAALAERRGVAEIEGLGDQPRIWLHASSVGEVGALSSLTTWLQSNSDASLFVTTSTRTGRERARSQLGLPAMLAPIDAPAALRRFLRSTRPAAHVIVETEIWPCRLSLLARNNIPAVIVSARLSPERWPRYARGRALYARALSSLRWLSPASSDDAGRFLRLGVAPRRLRLEGNLKWDAAPEAQGSAALATLRDSLALDPSRPWIILGSVHPGETSQLVRALLARFPGGGNAPGLLVAPRHPQRFDEIASEISALTGHVHRLSEGPAPSESRVLLLDKLGVLARLYPLGAVALMGGTFVPVGGHSPLEAAAGACPLVCGPHDDHQRDLVAPLESAGALTRTRDAEEAAETIARWISDPEKRELAGRRAREEVEKRRGQAARLGPALLELLP